MLSKSTYASLVSVVAGNFISTRVLSQTFQHIIDGRFHKFDYLSPKKNFRVYGQNRAPDYPLRAITARNIALFNGPNDSLGDRFDFDYLISSLSGIITLFLS